jgi:serine/threonine protein kinase
VNTYPLSTRIHPGFALPTAGGEEVVVRAWRGEGSHARVYEGRYSRTAGSCALKVAKPEVEGAALRLAAEQRVLTGLRHPRIVSLLDWGSHAGVPYLVLEWLDGDMLLDVVARRRRLALRQALEYAEQLFEGLAYLHGLRLAHGDVRSQNVLVPAGRGAVLTDPGAPEGTAEEDIRAAGRVLYLMLTGEDPLRDASRLTVAGGHNRTAVALWESSQAPIPPTASDLLAQVSRLRAAL